MQKKSGFTLIELLVVIAIIAILAAILFPVFARAREKARTSSCQSNTKQLALGFQMYVQDFDEAFPWYNAGLTCSNQADWTMQIYPYTKNLQLYVCPSADGGAAPTCPNGPAVVDYAMNEDLNGDSYSPKRTITLADIKSSAGVLSLTEGARNQNSMELGGTNGDWNYIIVNQATWFTGQTPIWRRHSEGSNYAFVDGHVKWLKLSAVGLNSTTAINGAAGSFSAWFQPGG